MGMTQQLLAEKMDVSFQAVSSWERDEFLPDTSKLKTLAAALKTSVSYLMEEQTVPGIQWELHDAMFSVDNMLRRVRMYAQAKKMTQTQKAIRIMLKYHDVVEDIEAALETLDVSDEIKQVVDLVTFEELSGMSREESYEIYYKKIGQNKIASMVKLLDRCNNVSTMATGFQPEKMARYIVETEEYVLPLIEKVKHEYDEYYDAAFLLKYHLLSVMESLKRTL